MVHIGVIGAGAVGLSSAINAQRAFPKAKVTLMADKFGKDTTSHGAGGLLRLVLDPGKPDYEIMRQCSQDSWDYIGALARSPSAGEAGISTTQCTAVYDSPRDQAYAFLRETSHDFRSLSADDLRKRGFEEKYKYGYAFTSYVVQCPYYLPWLMKKFQEHGGEIKHRTVNRLKELYGEFDVVINCSGLRAGQLAGDQSIGPVRGQLLYVKAPWIKQAYVADDMTYIIPQVDRLAVGVIREKGSYDTRIDPAVSQEMLARAEKLIPELKGGEFLGAWSDLRPTRDPIRLEIEHLDCGSGRTLPVIHNYGHGAHGIALSWGTSVYAISLLSQVIDGNSKASRL